MGVPLTSDLQKCVNTTRSALRGAGPSQLKDHFHVPVLTKVLQETAGTEGFTPERVTHMADALLICCWWMFREIEAAGSQVCHVSMNPGAMEVTIMLPVQKNDARGMLCCRTLRCACRVSRQALCPYHAVKRHLQRLALRGPEALASRAPLFPADDGGVLTKALFVKQVRATLGACEYEGQELQRFTGHIARVSGAQWLHNLGLPMQLVQILGRWASLTILKYLQSAPLQVLPESAANALVRGPVGGVREDAWMLVQGTEAGASTVLVRESHEEHGQPKGAVRCSRPPERGPAGGRRVPSSFV